MSAASRDGSVGAQRTPRTTTVCIDAKTRPAKLVVTSGATGLSRVVEIDLGTDGSRKLVDVVSDALAAQGVTDAFELSYAMPAAPLSVAAAESSVQYDDAAKTAVTVTVDTLDGRAVAPICVKLGGADRTRDFADVVLERLSEQGVHRVSQFSCASTRADRARVVVICPVYKAQ